MNYVNLTQHSIPDVDLLQFGPLEDGDVEMLTQKVQLAGVVDRHGIIIKYEASTVLVNKLLLLCYLHTHYGIILHHTPHLTLYDVDVRCHIRAII